MDMQGKPLLGVKPAWMAAWSRIAELIDAIERQYESPHGDARLVEKWAQEIGWQCSIIEAFEDEQRRKQRTDRNHIWSAS